MTQNEIKALKGIANRTWQQVFEIVVDAGRLYIGVTNDSENALVTRFYKEFNWKKRNNLIHLWFPCKSYE